MAEFRQGGSIVMQLLEFHLGHLLPKSLISP
jgi:hypothetical protein